MPSARDQRHAYGRQSRARPLRARTLAVTTPARRAGSPAAPPSRPRTPEHVRLSRSTSAYGNPQEDAQTHVYVSGARRMVFIRESRGSCQPGQASRICSGSAACSVHRMLKGAGAGGLRSRAVGLAALVAEGCLAGLGVARPSALLILG